jgi:hypothetical protein
VRSHAGRRLPKRQMPFPVRKRRHDRAPMRPDDSSSS